MQDRLDPTSRQQPIDEHLTAIRRLTEAGKTSAEDRGGTVEQTWPPRDFYLLWHVLIGGMLGFIGSAVSLLFNVVGAWMMGV